MLARERNLSNSPIIQNMGNVHNVVTIFFASDKNGLGEQAIVADSGQDSAKQRFIDRGLIRLHNVAKAVDDLIGFVEDNRYKPADEVDGKQMVAYEEALYFSCNELLNQMDLVMFDDFVRAVTGSSMWGLIIKAQIEAGAGDSDFWQREINDIAKKQPVVAAELQILLNEQLGLGVGG